jgi:Small, acid-soluble spore proteins, alpha/beta type
MNFEHEYLKQKAIKKELEKLKYETASELGIDLNSVPTDTTSRNIGTFAGPVGGGMVKSLVAQAQEQLVRDQLNR